MSARTRIEDEFYAEVRGRELARAVADRAFILARRALKRALFTSIDDLRQRLLDFIEYFDTVLAKPFRWTYAGKPLQA